MARKTLGDALDGDVNLKIGVLMMVIFLAGFIGSNCAGLLVDFCGGLKIIGILAISSGEKNSNLSPQGLIQASYFSFFSNIS